MAETKVTVKHTGEYALDNEGTLREVLVYNGKSTFTKPTEKVADTSVYFEKDTFDVYMFDADTSTWMNGEEA